uniref:Uncharacterized protein n=1 Tax=viral metagenome TaxID=1070528 RepID=A0A6H1ZHT2_9ZZZZ
MIYKTILTMNGKDYEGKGDTLFDALSNIPLTYLEIKNKGVIKVIKKEGKKIKTAEKLFVLRLLRMIFANKLRRHAWAKNLDYLLMEAAHNEK